MDDRSDLSAVTIDFSSHTFEQHVGYALRTAHTLAGDRPIEAREALRAVIIVNRYAPSEAFSTLSSLLQLTNLPEVPMPQDLPDPQDRLEVCLSQPLAASYAVAERFVVDDTIWGRDFITMALLADYDPSLNEVASEAGTTVDGLQDAWFRFVTSSDRRRNRASWVAWWGEAGIPLPEERDHTRDPSSSAPPATYLFTWNPATYEEGKVEKFAQEIRNSGSTTMKWSTGTRRHVLPESRVFLMRQGVEPLGLVGSGRIQGQAKETPHWDEEKSKEGRTFWGAPVRWDTLSTQPIITREALLRETGEQKLWDTQAGGIKMRPDVATTLEELWLKAKTGTPITEALHFAKTLSDLDHRNDWIGIRADVEALSTLVAINRVEPPLSIAIFGDWGSGKTFLMKKMQERIQILEGLHGALAREPGARNPAEEASATDAAPLRYCSSILQVEFNTWHYTESNLWASLVNHIFEKLQERLTPAEAETDEEHVDPVEEFFKQFETARAAREAAEAQIRLITAEVTQAQNTLRSAERQVQVTKDKLATAVAQNVWSRLDEILGRNGGEKQGEALNQALQHFGFGHALQSARTIYDTVSRFRSVSGRAREILGSLFATPEGMLGALILAVVVMVATGFAVTYEAPILSIGSAIAGGLAWMAERTGSARQWLEKIQSFDDWFSDMKEKQESQIAKEIAEAQADFEQQKDVLSTAQRQLGEAKAREAQAKAEIAKLTVRDQMRRFVDERVTTQTYAKHLGLISMIRRDFEDLSDFMYRDQQPGEARLVQRITEAIQEAIPTVERIILYIDDLDRCQPERVVEVLEAIHLLLSFRLFIVVVAVDPRWVLESLRQHYPHLAEEPRVLGMAASSGPGHRIGKQVDREATAHDYLEKIFHIPFWVKPMNPEACESLIAGYLDFATQEDHEAGEAARFHDLTRERVAQESTVTARHPVGPTDRAKASLQDTKSQTPALSPETLERQERERTAARRTIENVMITPAEQQFIRRLAPHLGNSPRRIKRYANTYRLLKSGLTREEARQFAEGNDAVHDYQVVLVFLAIVTGAPTLAPHVFSKAFELRNNFDVHTLMQETGLEDPLLNPFEVASAKGALSLLAGSPLPKAKLETWIPCVMRYAFRLTPVDVTAR
jgi:hypothetical protein